MPRRLYLHLDDRCVVRSPTDRTPVTELRFHRGDCEDLEICFVQDHAVTDPGSITGGVLGIKRPLEFEAESYITSASSWVKTGTGTSTKFTTTLDLRIEAINDDLGHLGDNVTTDDLAQIAYAADITWELSDKPSTIGPIGVIVVNDYTKGGEGLGTAEEGHEAGGDLTGTYPSPTVAGWLGRPLDTTAPSGHQFYIWDTGDAEFKLAGTVTNDEVRFLCPDGTTRRVLLSDL